MRRAWAIASGAHLAGAADLKDLDLTERARHSNLARAHADFPQFVSRLRLLSRNYIWFF